MPGASVFFYGRRSPSSRTFHHLASTTSSSTVATTTHRRRHNHRHRSTNDTLCRHNRHITPVDPPLLIRSPPHAPPHAPHHPALSPLPESEPQHRGCIGASPSQDVTHETIHHLSRRYSRNNRLPEAVLLAKERLLERLRGVSVSGGRPRRDRSVSLLCEDFWVIYADWATSVIGEQPALDTILNETPAGAHVLATPQELNKKPMGLTNETLSQLHHEIFQEHQIDTSYLESEESTECCICLETFAQGNELMGLPCGHRFHTSCLSPWLRTCGECPYCRSCILPCA